MLPAGIFLVVSSLFMAYHAHADIPKASNYTDIFPPSAYPFAEIMNVSDIPQFITITLDDGLSPARIAPIRDYLLSIRDSRGCAPRFTHFTSFDYSLCPLVEGIYKAGMELGTHSVGHNWYANREEIEGAYTEMEKCGVPLEEVKGYRAPYLKFNQETLENLMDIGALYETSVEAGDAGLYYTDEHSNFGRETIWPFTWESFPKDDIFCGEGWNCDSSNGLDGLWEIPMNFWFMPTDNPEEVPTRTYNSMDYNDFSKEMATQNFLRRYENNRAPFGIFIHADPWLVNNGAILKEWIEDVLANPAYSDVHFVTNIELLEWMKNPVPKDQYQPRDCHAAGDVFDCFPPAPEYKCQHGEQWNKETCQCECTVEGFCLKDGFCTNYCPDEGPIVPQDDMCCDEGFTGYNGYDDCTKYYHCVDGVVAGSPVTCGAGYLYDKTAGYCNIDSLVTCEIQNCTDTTPRNTPLDSTPSPTTSPVATSPVTEDTRCCDEGFTGYKAHNGCTEYYHCVNGVVLGALIPCQSGLLFDGTYQVCNFASHVTCNIQSCPDTPTGAPVASTTSPTASPVVPTVAPVTPTASPIVPTEAPVGPTAAPVNPPPTAAPVSSPPTDPSVGCCSQNHLTCNVDWCGNDQAGCDACAQWANYYWMANGPPAAGSCVGKWDGCTNGETCCPGLECSGSPGDSYRQCGAASRRRMLRGEQ